MKEKRDNYWILLLSHYNKNALLNKQIKFKMFEGGIMCYTEIQGFSL